MFITGALYVFPCFLISTICCGIKASIQFNHFLSFHCLSDKLCNELVAKNYLMVTACGQRFNIISFVSFTGPMSEAYFWRGMFVGGFMLRTKQNLTLICFSRFHMFASKLSINDETACLKTWFSCGRTRSFRHFLESSRSFSFFYPEPFICEKSVLNFRGVGRGSEETKRRK